MCFMFGLLPKNYHLIGLPQMSQLDVDLRCLPLIL
jgi:hypothetical protein